MTLTARPLSHTIELLEDWGHPHTVIGRHGGASRARARRARPPEGWRSLATVRPRAQLRLRRSPTARPMSRPCARLRRIPSNDDVRLRVGVVPARRQLPARRPRVGPGRDPLRAPGALRSAGAQTRPLPRPEGGVLPLQLRARRAALDSLGAEPRRLLSSCAPRPPTPSTSVARRPRSSSPSCSGSWRTSPTQTVVLARNDEQRGALRELALERLLVPERAIDGRSLVAFADLLVSAGGTMNREAAALDTPAWSIFEGPHRRRRRAARTRRPPATSSARMPTSSRRRRPRVHGAGRVRRDPAQLVRLAVPAEVPYAWRPWSGSSTR